MTVTKSVKITKAIFPVAGLGTRFLPATKASPKEMLPVVDKPLIQYAVEEAAAAGITEMIFITGRGKRTIEDHFDKAYELEAELHLKGKIKVLNEVRSMLPANVRYVYESKKGIAAARNRGVRESRRVELPAVFCRSPAARPSCWVPSCTP